MTHFTELGAEAGTRFFFFYCSSFVFKQVRLFVVILLLLF